MTTADKIEAIDHPLKAPELARLLGLSLQRVYKMARDHELPSFRFGTSVRFDSQALADWLRKKSGTQKLRATVLESVPPQVNPLPPPPILEEVDVVVDPVNSAVGSGTHDPTQSRRCCAVPADKDSWKISRRS
jgi:excisionase family DNA binding protein